MNGHLDGCIMKTVSRLKPQNL